MIVVADSSPLVILAKLRCFDLLNKIYAKVSISTEVHREVVVSGAGLPGASEVANASWVEVRAVQPARLAAAIGQKHALGAGELSTILLAKEIGADTVLLDDHKARRLAANEGLRVRGSVGLLESFYVQGHLADLREAFRQLRASSYIEENVLNVRLRALGLPPL